jgi:hypothetical protein
MKNLGKKIISITLNIILCIMFILYTTLSATGQLTYSESNILLKISSYIFMSIPLLVMIAIAMSISYRNDEKYVQSIFIQVIPFLGLLIAQFFSFLSLI